MQAGHVNGGEGGQKSTWRASSNDAQMPQNPRRRLKPSRDGGHGVSTRQFGEMVQKRKLLANGQI